MLAGALIRHSFVARHKALVQGKPVPWRYAVVGSVLIAGLAVWLRPAPGAAASAHAPVTYAELRKVLDTRCVPCHNEQVASKNVMLHTPEQVAKNAQMMVQQAVALKTMPLNNATQITDAERDADRPLVQGGCAGEVTRDGTDDRASGPHGHPADPQRPPARHDGRRAARDRGRRGLRARPRDRGGRPQRRAAAERPTK